MIVPDGVLFGSSKAHKELRKILVEDQKLDAVIKGAPAQPLTAYVDATASRPRLEKAPAPGTITRTATKPATGKAKAKGRP